MILYQAHVYMIYKHQLVVFYSEQSDVLRSVCASNKIPTDNMLIDI